MKKISLIGILLCLCSCVSQLYIPIENSGTITLENLTLGRKIYVTKCSNCHQLYSPNKYNSVEWQKNLNWMQRKAKITDDQKNLIFDYLINAPK